MGRAAFCVMGFYLKLRIVDGLFYCAFRCIFATRVLVL